MAEPAARSREIRQNWAAPGTQHDRIVRFAKIALPAAVGILVVFLALAPLDRGSESSFILDKNKVENAPERMRVDVARYTGEDKQGRPFEIVAQSAVQQSSETPVVDIRGMLGRLSLVDGLISMTADAARYNLDEQKLQVVGPIRVTGPDYGLETSNVEVDMRQRAVTGSGGVEGRIPLGTFTAGELRGDLGERTVTLDKGARLKIVQGAVR